MLEPQHGPHLIKQFRLAQLCAGLYFRLHAAFYRTFPRQIKN
jgi:hypothetical protein